ncbi:MAG: hypothetical protein U0790_15990 [Isosphaeraceae bacterium]
MDEHLISRREWSRRSSAAALACLAAQPPGSGPGRRFRLLETAGLRRFGYPVHAEFPKPTGATRFTLIQDGKPVPAQFRAVRDASGAERVSLDFNASLGPLESAVYEVRSGEDGPDAEPRRGLKVESAGDSFRIDGTGMIYEVPMDLSGFLGRVAQGDREFLGRKSTGLWLRPAGRQSGGSEPRPLALRGVISRRGPLAMGLRYDGVGNDDGRRVAVAVELTFPSSKSWVELNASIGDSGAGPAYELGIDLDLAIEGSPTLVDLGATGTVYGTLQGEERLSLIGLPGAGWEVIKGDRRQDVLQAKPPRGPGKPDSPNAEGWAHVMDATRCTAVAVADFGTRARDQIEVSANGRLRVTRRFPEGTQGPRSLRAWYHFVPMPVQVGAVTSPQSMLAPLEVEWIHV